MSENNILRYPDVEWSLPLLFHFEPVFGVLCRQLEAAGLEPPKANIYGSPACAWTGGRPPSIYDKFNKKTLKKVFEYIKYFGGSPALTLTCPSVTKAELDDPYCNMIMETAFEANAHFIIFDDKLRDYIKNKNPDAYVVASVVKSFFKFQDPASMKAEITDEETEYYNKLLKEYDMVVVRPEYSKFFLADHPDAIDDISRVEVLINQPCILYCPKEREHQQSYQYIKLHPDVNYHFDACPLKKLTLAQIVDGKHTCPHTTEEVNRLLKVGVKRLKVQGREQAASLVETLAMVSNQIIKQTGYDFYFYQNTGRKIEPEVDFFKKFIDKARAE